MFGISGPELLVIFVVLLVIIGPSRLPEVTATVTKWVKNARVQLTKLRASLDGEVGDDLRNIDLSVLDVRQYDPRNIIRQAVQEEMEEWRQLVSPLSPTKKPAATSTVTPPTPVTPEPSASEPASAASTSSIGPGSVVQAVASAGAPRPIRGSGYRASTRDEAIAAWFASQRKRHGFGSRSPQPSHRARMLRDIQQRRRRGQ